MNESLNAQYAYFISQCKTLEELSYQESRLKRSYPEIPDSLKQNILEKRERLERAFSSRNRDDLT